MPILVGAILGLVIGLIFAGIFWYIASQKKPSFDAAVSRSATFNVDMPPAAAIARIKDAAPAMKLGVALSDDPANRVILDEAMSFWSYGAFVQVTAVGAGAGAAITVDLMNKAPQYGPVVTKRHRSLVERIKGALGAA
jgi:hypothetical protein